MLCLSVDLSSSDAAAWVQAAGSIVAIFGAAGIAGWQARRQYADAIALENTRRLQERLYVAESLLTLCKNAHRALSVILGQLSDREAIYLSAEGMQHLDLGELRRLDVAVSAIPLHGLPGTLVSWAMIASSSVRQLREKVELVLRVHRTMDAAAFTDFFGAREGLLNSLELTCDDIGREVGRLSAEIEQGLKRA